MKRIDIIHVILITGIMILNTASWLPLVAQASDTPTETELLSLDFSNEVEALKHLDTTTENYDSENDGSSREYVDTTNQWFVFEGDNSQASFETDMPIAVIKGYSENDGYDSYAVLPYNYSVSVDFMVPPDEFLGLLHGNMYILPRYADASNKYEVAVDVENGKLVFSYTKDGAQQTLKTSSLGFTIEGNKWYRLEVQITWEYNSTAGKYMNHIYAKVTDLSNAANVYKDEVWDDNLEPASYNGLAFLGFDDNNQFKVYMDNVNVTAQMLELGREPDESSVSGWGGGDLDVSGLWALADGTSLFVKIPVASAVSTSDTKDAKYWIVEFDVDRDSKDPKTGLDSEYLVNVTLLIDGSAMAGLYTSNGDLVRQLHVLGGGIGYDYLVVGVGKSDLTGLGEALYLYGHTQLGATLEDSFPNDDTGGSQAGDYYIWYIVEPSPTSDWVYQSDAKEDTTAPGYLDIVALQSAYDDVYMYFNLSLGSAVPWTGGEDTAIYRFYIDADQDTSTGFYYDKPSPPIGADYLIVFTVGYVPELYKYDGTGSDWVWTLVENVDYLYNPGDSNSIVILAPKNAFTQVPLGSQVNVASETGISSVNYDYTDDPLPAPVPEPAYLALAVILVTLLLSWKYLRAKTG
ncbi:MAG: hypothetical protein GSR73_06995 [Desulfurococcales archaeon]|nr:hypothetical protein [Desulfurococcales archaeon]